MDKSAPLTLLECWLEIVRPWRSVFPQERTFHRAVRQALGSLVCLGRRCLTRIIWTNGGQDRIWSAEYFLFSRCQWDPQQLFQPVLKRALAFCPSRLVAAAIDDTRLRKTGRAIPQAFFQRDPLSPPFHLNLVLGCASCRLRCWCRCIATRRSARALCRSASRKFRASSARARKPARKCRNNIRKR